LRVLIATLVGGGVGWQCRGGEFNLCAGL